MVRRNLFFACIILFCFLALDAGQAAGGNITRISSGSAKQSYPAVSSELVAWIGEEFGEEHIYLRQFGDGKEKKITRDARTRKGLVIGGNRLVWSERMPSGVYEISTYDLASNNFSVLTDSLGDQLEPSIYGDKLVWSGLQDGKWQVFLYDFTKKVKEQITRERTNCQEPSIFGGNVVWSQEVDQRWQLVLYDLLAKEKRFIGPSDSDQVSPSIWGDTIIWADNRNDNWDIYSYDLNSKTVRAVTLAGGDQVSPKISGHVVVWQDRRNGNWDIYAYDFKTGREFPVCVADKDQTDPRIYGNTIVWVDERDDKKAIYMATISGNALEEVRTEEPVTPKSGDGHITIKVNGRPLITEVSPILVNDTTLIPARAVAEALGAKVDWLEHERSVEITRGQVKVKVYPDKTLAFINGKQYALPAPPQIINGCTMLPLRFLAETLGATVNWHKKEKLIEVRL